MCLTRVKKICVARKDIVCYKFFRIKTNGQLISPYRDFIWPKKELLLNKKIFIDQFKQIEEGLHAFIEKKSIGNIYGYYSFKEDKTIKKMIIPKGTKYARGKYGVCDSIVAEKMVFSKYYKKKKI